MASPDYRYQEVVTLEGGPYDATEQIVDRATDSVIYQELAETASLTNQEAVILPKAGYHKYFRSKENHNIFWYGGSMDGVY
jgi:hypothetical protein